MKETRSDFPEAKDSRFIPNAAEITQTLPSEISLVKGTKFLCFEYKHRFYTLGISPEGFLLGFCGKLNGSTLAALVVVRSGEGFAFFDRRFSPCLAEELAKLESQMEAAEGRYLMPEVPLQKAVINDCAFASVSFDAK